MDERSRQRLPILASSARKAALAQRLDWRVLERLRETCTAHGAHHRPYNICTTQRGRHETAAQAMQANRGRWPDVSE